MTTGAQEHFDAVAAEHLGEPHVTRGRMFRSDGLQVHGKIFAMVVDDRLVVKLPQDRVASLVDSGAGFPFRTGGERVMREWVALPVPAEDDTAPWRAAALEARTYVASLVTSTPGRRD